MAPRKSSSSSSMAPVIAIVGVIALLAGGFGLLAKQDDATPRSDADAVKKSAAESPSTNPFADVSVEMPGDKRKKRKQLAPPNMDQTPIWVEAKTMADQGKTLIDEALVAQKKGDEDTYRDKGLRGAKLLEDARTKCVDWWIDQYDKYPGDIQLERMSRQMKSWTKARKKVRFLD